MRHKSPQLNIILTLTFLFYTFMATNADGFESMLNHIRSRTTLEEQGIAAMDVIKRLLPDHADFFSVVVDMDIGPKGKDTFQVVKSDEDEVVRIVGSSGVAATSGFHHYLKYYCQCQVSWDSDQLDLPDKLPTVNITIMSADRFRYYQNVCTTSYSFVWWDWKRWEREIDWMALNGFNLALAFTGQEAIWQRVYQQLNLTKSEIQEHFGGPAFLSWARMGNLRGWGGPLTDNWHSQSLVLQQRILARMRELGILPILPAFAGHVPRAFKRLYPDAQMTLMTRWLEFNDEYCCPYLLEPTDPLFRTIGNLFTKELIAEFGTDHLYNCDTFNEMKPAHDNVTYLAQVGQAIFKGMTDVDPKAIWVLQGWLFVNAPDFWSAPQIRAFLNSVPIGRMIVLDLQSEQNPVFELTESYYGQPFIWCMLHNFGGTLGLFGTVESVNNGLFEARKMVNSTMIGSGLTPEGINQNYVMYDLMNDMSWRSEPFNLTEWFSAYSVRRYGAENKNAEHAWQLLKKSAYNCTNGYSSYGQYVISQTPSLELEEPLWYNTSDLVEAWDELLAATPSLNQSLNYQHDLVDVTRQALQLLAAGSYTIFVKAFKKKDIHTFQKYAEFYLDLLNDLDIILASNKDFLLGTWLNTAKAKGVNHLERRVYEYNARNQITLWGPRGEIQDYANKQWAGVVSHYFLPRWQMFLTALNDSLIDDIPFNDTLTRNKIFLEVEEPFTLDTTEFPDIPQGDTIELAIKLHKKWRNRSKAWRAVQRFAQYSPVVHRTALTKPLFEHYDNDKVYEVHQLIRHTPHIHI